MKFIHASERKPMKRPGYIVWLLLDNILGRFLETQIAMLPGTKHCSSEWLQILRKKISYAKF